MKFITFLLTGTAILVGVGIGFAICTNTFNAWERKIQKEKQELFSQYLPPIEKIALVDPQMAPESIKEKVVEGFNIINQTYRLLPQFVGGRLNCTNCHIASGNTLGGVSGGIPLVGVTRVYPTKNPDGSLFTLEDRINNCFLRSMNGRKIPVDSSQMQAIVSYLTWISSTIPADMDPTWLGQKDLPIEYVPDRKRGQERYLVNCSMCHGVNGDGQSRLYELSYPPLWGKDSFNASAGMNGIKRFASFIYYNMPYQNPQLTMEEAMDIASFVTTQPRPKEE